MVGVKVLGFVRLGWNVDVCGVFFVDVVVGGLVSGLSCMVMVLFLCMIFFVISSVLFSVCGCLRM